jgi:hypothetical protein
MTMPPTKLLVAWTLGVLLMSGTASTASGQSSPVATSPKGQVTQKPRQSAPTGVLAAPAASPTSETSPGAAAAGDATSGTTAEAAPAMSVAQARGALERGMTELGELAARARQSGDALRIACVQDKQDRASAVMEVATGDMLVVQDPATDAQTRAFATDKLGESAEQMKGLVGQARACQGREEAADGKASNEARTPQGVLPQDPTGPGAPASRGLPPIDPRPPVASPVL